MSRDLRITVQDDGALVVSETDLTGKRLTYRVPPESAHDWTVANGAVCSEHDHVYGSSKTTETAFETVEFDDLSPEAQREVAEHATLTDLKADRAEIKRLAERWAVLVEQKTLAELDDRNLAERAEVLERIAEEMKEIRERSVILEACTDIAQATIDDEGTKT